MGRPTTTLGREVLRRALSSTRELPGMDGRIDELLAHTAHVRLVPGEALFCEGELAPALYIVVEGALQVVATGHDGRELILSRLDAGDVFGEQAVLAAEPGRRGATVRAAEPALLLRLDREAFRPAGAGDDPLEQRLRELGETTWLSAEIIHELHLTEAVRSFRLATAPGRLQRWRAGQHVTIGARIDGYWVDRRYMITAAPGDPTVEVTVMREPQGLLSNWLFDRRGPHESLRVSDPQGEAAWELGGEPALCFVAGIGAAPAVAACRALGGTAPAAAIHIDYSGRRATELAYVHELRGLDAITVDVRETATDGRLTAAHVRELVALHPGARVLVCGPHAYMRDVGFFLRTAGLPADRIHLEVFTHAGEPVAASVAAPRRPKRAPGEPDGSTPYERFVRTEELLSLQVGPHDWSHPDELLFVIVHQASELWLKLAATELAQCAAHLDDGDIAPALRQLRRAVLCLKNVTDGMDMLDQMSPWEYQIVRKALGGGSGFDSPGFRGIRDVSPHLGERFHALRDEAGLSLLEVYTRGREHEDLYQLAEHLVEWDERVTMWRMRHLKIAERTIGGSVAGTQGTPVEVLGKLIFKSFYPELWQIRSELTAQADLEPAPLASDQAG